MELVATCEQTGAERLVKPTHRVQDLGEVVGRFSRRDS